MAFSDVAFSGAEPALGVIPGNASISDDLVPPGVYWSRVIRRGQTLRIVDVDGARRGVAARLQRRPAERALQRARHDRRSRTQIFLTTGRVLFSDLGRVLFSDRRRHGGHHDTLAGFGDAATTLAQYGPGRYLDLRNDFHRNARDNFVTALGRHGLDRRDLVPTFNLFARVARRTRRRARLGSTGVQRAGRRRRPARRDERARRRSRRRPTCSTRRPGTGRAGCRSRVWQASGRRARTTACRTVLATRRGAGSRTPTHCSPVAARRRGAVTFTEAADRDALAAVVDETVGPGEPWTRVVTAGAGPAHRRSRGQPGRRHAVLQRRTTPTSATAPPTRSAAQGNIYLTTGTRCMSQRGRRAADDRRRHLRPPRHARRRLLAPRATGALRRSTRSTCTTAATASCSALRAAARHGQARPRAATSTSS